MLSTTACGADTKDPPEPVVFTDVSEAECAEQCVKYRLDDEACGADLDPWDPDELQAYCETRCETVGDHYHRVNQCSGAAGFCEYSWNCDQVRAFGGDCEGPADAPEFAGTYEECLTLYSVDEDDIY